MKTRKIIYGVIIITLVSTGLAQAQTLNQEGPLFTLTILVTPGDAFNYGVYIIKYLKDINIDAKIKVFNYDCNFPNSYPNINKDWDLAICSFKGGGKIPDLRYLYTEEGSQNIFNLNSNIPNQTESESMQNEAVTISDLDERQQLYYDWQQLVMTNIVPILPLFSCRFYTSIWSNTEGFDMRWGFSDSSPYMNFNGLHEGQESIDEFNLAHYECRSGESYAINNYFKLFQWELISEPLIQWSPDNAPIKSGIIRDWEEVEENHFKFYIRDNVYWNPSFNITERTSDSAPLLAESSPGIWEVQDPSLLIPGLKAGEVSEGTNQKITALDAVFSLLVAANPIVSDISERYRWLSECYLDTSDPLVFHLHIDDNPGTAEKEPNVNFYSFLDLIILPEFFLNSTDNTITITSGGISCTGLNETITETMQWKSYENTPFSCGKYLLNYYDNNPHTVLSRSPFWFGIGPIDGIPGKIPFVDTVNLFKILDKDARIQQFKSGELDLIQEEAERRLMQEQTRFEVQTEIQNAMSLIAFNLEREFIGGSSNNVWIEGSDGKNYTEACAVRKAICYAIDREEMNQVLHDGEYTLFHNPMYLYTAFYYYDDVIKYYHDLDAAWEWMEAAGYKVDLTNIYPSVIIAVFCLISISKIVYKKKIRKEKKKS